VLALWALNCTKETLREFFPPHKRFVRSGSHFLAHGEPEVHELPRLVEPGTVAVEGVKDGQGESLAGLAGGAVGEGPVTEGDDVRTGGVAVEDLEQGEEKVVAGSRTRLRQEELTWRHPSSIVSEDKAAAMSRRSRSRMGMIHGGLGGLRRAPVWGRHQPRRMPGVPGPPHQNRRTGTNGGSGIWRESELLRHIIASFHDVCGRFS